MPNTMNFDFGLQDDRTKKRFRWLFFIPEVCSSGTNALPPLRSARPDIKWKEMNVNHVSEEIFYPAKPEWTPVSITLYDLCRKNPHPVFKWLKKMYDPAKGKLYAPLDNQFITWAKLELYDGCGNVTERWIFEDVWPQDMNFQDLDMSSSEVVVCDLVLRYARAYVED